MKIGNSVKKIIRDSVNYSINHSNLNFVSLSVWGLINHSVNNSVRGSVNQIVWASVRNKSRI